MKHFKIITLFILFVLPFALNAQDKLAQSGFQFLSIGNDARMSSMAGALTALEGQSTSLFCNPAGMANMETFINASFGINKWIADIRHNIFSMAINPLDGKYGVFGFTLQTVDYGEIQGTMAYSNLKGYVDTEILEPTALALGFGYAKALTDRFSVGGHIKGAYQNLGKSIVPTSDSLETRKNYADAIAFDFGTLFKTGFKSLAFGMSIRNFSKEVQYEEEDFQLPLLFTMGISMNVLDFVENESFEQSLIFSIDATHPRAYHEQLHFGIDYTVMNILSLRMGYTTETDEEGISYGAGFAIRGIGVDYSYTPFGVFDKIQRVSARVSL